MNKRGLAAVGAACLVVLLLVGGYFIYRLLHPVYLLQAPLVTAEPKLDGRADDPAWQQATAVTIPIEGADPVTLKAVRTADKIFFQARFKDATRDDIDEPWTYDGSKWVRGRTSDQFALFFEFGKTVKDFDALGFAAMNFGFKPGNKLWEFGQSAKRIKKGYWPGYAGRADVWMMHSSISSPFGLGDDGIYQVNQEYLLSPTTTDPFLLVHWDQFSSPRVLSLNTQHWQEALAISNDESTGKPTVDQPYLMYKPGLDLANTPYPYEDQLTLIPDGTKWKKGDKLPWVYFSRELAGKWGGSRSDITGKMAWRNGWWTVEFGRKIDTGNADDLAFKSGQASQVTFGVLVRRDGKTIKYSPPAKFEMAAK